MQIHGEAAMVTLCARFTHGLGHFMGCDVYDVGKYPRGESHDHS